MSDADAEVKKLMARFGEILDEIDEVTRKEGEPSLRQIVAEHARTEREKYRSKEPTNE